MRYVRSVMGARHAGLAAFAPEALAEYERCIASPGTRARRSARTTAPRAGIDLEHDRADSRPAGALDAAAARAVGRARRGRRAASTCWRCGASAPTTCRGRHACPAATTFAEEAPGELLAEALPFFNATQGLTP